MSLIRCLNNPEGLHVFSDGANTHFLVTSTGSEFVVPDLHFDRIMKKCHKEWEGIPGSPITSGNIISLEEVGSDKKTNYGKVRLTYDGLYMDMWGVTFFYIYSHWLKHQ